MDTAPLPLPLFTGCYNTPMSVRPEVLAAPAYHFSAKPYTVKLDQNESPYDLPSELKREVLTRLERVPANRYPELAGESLRAALAQRHGWDEAGVVVGGGSNTLVQAFVIACGLGRRVLSVTPTFSVYSLCANLLNAELTEVPLGEDFALPTEALKAELQRGQGVLFLAVPAAPTGNVFVRADLEDLIRAAAPNWTVVLDEAYCQFSQTDLSHFVRTYPHVACLRTLSKAFGMGGVRLGFALAQPALAEQLQKVIMPFSVSSLQLAVGLTALAHPDFVAARVTETLREREKLASGLRALNLQVFPSEANFLLFRVTDAPSFYEALLARGVLIRRQDHLRGLHGCLRVSVGTPQENAVFLEAARDVLSKQVQEVSGG